MAPRYGFTGEVAQFSGIGTDVPQPGVNYGPVVSVAGECRYWSEFGVYAAAGMYPYVGSAIPEATVARKGKRILVANSAVPRNKSVLECTGTIWAPPAGELICLVAGSGPASPVASVSPGVLVRTEIYASPGIPDYMIPDKLLISGRGMGMGVRNTVSQAASAQMAITLSSSVQDADMNNALVSATTAPNNSASILAGAYNKSSLSWRDGNSFRGANGSTGIGSVTSSMNGRTTGSFGSGSAKLRFTGLAGHVSDVFDILEYAVYSEGNL